MNEFNPNHVYPAQAYPILPFFYPQTEQTANPSQELPIEAAQLELEKMLPTRENQAPANNHRPPPTMLPMQQSYIENILRLNRGKEVTAYLSFSDKKQQTFTGIIEGAGRDHVILNNTTTGDRYLLLMIYLDYVLFKEEINYIPPQFPGSDQLSTSEPR